MTQFTDLGLAKPLLKALADEGYTQPTPIQAQAIPGVMAGKDLLGIAQTGTGKTAAFALPILHRLADDRRPAPRRSARVLVLAPTRELATQIGESFKAYGKHMGVSVAVIFGGVKHGPQMRALAGGVDVLVATPGRLLDHLSEKSMTLEGVEIFVLDEADQMLDMGFIVPIRRIVRYVPKARQNLFFSATMPKEIETLAGEILNPNPLKVSVTPQATTVERINQRVLFVEQQRKRALLAELFDDASFKRVIVFTRTKRGADRVARGLEQVGVDAAAIHGDKSQGQRERALAAFKAGEVRALVATDIAARGIDIDAVSHVVQFELPNVPEAYVHRIGRTARAGADGSAVAFCADDERGLLKDIEKVTRQRIPSFDRRNDRQLGAATAALPEPAGKAERPERGQGRPQGRPQGKAEGKSQPHRGGHAPKRNRSHAGGGGGQRAEGAPPRPAGGKPAFKGAGRNRNRSGGDRSSGASGVWSNR
ncbi:DEAD/DEAH box helicase [Phenylobacterium sp. SCN 70-31]|uniref:DEAD/DEAH box helicase n=1 Tax=Phenylobacterium sp. SCN 70-31 TaxID=1660129 RepID=UPI0008688CB7|nr:DEAD/DEAH box helicase [Phenylobacterium sp. SCN 70-31]ODT88751.1 MAG: RNA helicase [Phenylobacterium sp. SCN 70-31]